VPRAIIDPGADTLIIGGVGWTVISQINKSYAIGGVLVGMNARDLPMVCAATICEHSVKGPVLLGVGAAAMEVTIVDVREQHSATQWLGVDGIDVPLAFVDEARCSSVI